MITDAISSYDEKIGNVRHKENTRKLDSIFEMIYNIKGGVTALKWIGGVTGFCCTILGIIMAIRKW